MEKFAGWDGGQIIHDYLKNLESYFHLGGVSKDKDMGVLLYSRMLTSHVKVQMNEHKDSYAAMKKALLRSYGEPKQILKIQMEKLGNIKPPAEDDMKSEIMYLRQFHSELKRIRDLVEELGQDTALGLEFYREGCFVDILTLIGIGFRPVYKEWTRKEYTRLKIREEEKGVLYHYSVYYNKFLKFIENFWKGIEIQINLRRGNQLFGKSKPKWSDPLGVPALKGEESQKIDQLKAYLESKKANLSDTVYDEMSEMIDGLYTARTPSGKGESKPGKPGNDPNRGGKFALKNRKKVSRDSAPDNFNEGCKLRCFVCPLTKKKHELASCETGLGAGNKQRRRKAISLALCLACLRRDCRKKIDEGSVSWVCENRHQWLACDECTNDAVSNGKNSWTTNILVCTRHKVNVDSDMLEELVSRLGNSPKIDPVFSTNQFSRSTGINFTNNQSDEEIPRFQEIDDLLDLRKMVSLKSETVKFAQGNSIADSRSILKHSNKKVKTTTKSKSKHGKRRTCVEETSEVFNSKTGERAPITKDTKIKEESNEDTLYYFQMIRIGGYTILLFYDNGASVGIILGAIAELLKLEVLDRSPQAISGAANMLHRSPYGKYGMAIGPLSDGSFHKVSLTGLQQITHAIPVYDLCSLTEEARAHSKEMGLELAESIYPTKVGGNAAGMVLGMRTPHLLPKEQFTLPSGLLVSRTEIMDVYGSRLVFGGTIAQITQANEIAGIHCTSLEGQKFYHTEYLVFRDSINGHRNLTENLEVGTQIKPTLIRDEDENKSCGFMDCYNCKKKQNSINAIDVSLCVTGELRSRSKKEWEFQEFHTQNEDITTHLDISTDVCEQEEAISNFNKTFNWSKGSKRDIKSNTIAGPVLHYQQTKFSTPKDVENHNLGSSKEELEYDLASSSVESEVELDSFEGEPEKERRFSEEGIQVKVCGPYNISQQLLCTQRIETAIIAEDFTKMRLIEIGSGSQYENPRTVYVGFLLQEGTFARSISTGPISVSYTHLRAHET